MECTHRLALLVSLVVAMVGTAQQSSSPSCNKPYDIGMLVSVSSEDLRRDTSKPCTEKQLKQSQMGRLWNRCDAFVHAHPNKFVSANGLTDTIKGCMSTSYRCESFCGTREDRMKAVNENVENTLHPQHTPK